MVGNAEDLAALRARLGSLRRCLGAHLAGCRHAGGVSQGELAHALGRTRSQVSKVEHGTRTMPEPLWDIADQVCRAGGVLITEHRTLAQVERDYRRRWRVQHRAGQKAAARARAAAPVAGALPGLLCDPEDQAWHDAVLDGISGELAQELMAVIDRLARSVGRRRAMQLASWMLATVGLSDLDGDEQARVAHAVATPGRVDAQVVQNLAATLAHCRRLDDALGPRAVLATVQAQHELVHHLLHGGSEQWHKPLRLLDSSMAAAISNYLIDMGDLGAARGWFAHARKASHNGGHAGLASYAAAHLSWAAWLAGDTPAALDAAAAARSLAARTNDPQVKALAEKHAAGAHALEGHYDACLAAVERAHDLLTTMSAPAPGSPAYWIGHPSIDKGLSTFFVLLDRPRQAVDAASDALAHFDRTNVRYAMYEVRLGRALVLAQEIPEAARILGTAARQAHLYPRLATELRTTRALLQPWRHTHSVAELDAQLHAHGLLVP